MADPHAETTAPAQVRPRRFGDPEQSVLVAIAAMLFAVLVREITGGEGLARIGAFDLNAGDPAFVLTCFAAVRCWLDRPLNLNAATLPALLLAALICVGFLRGIDRNLFLGFIWLRSAGFLAPIMVIGATLRPRAETFAAMRTMIVAAGLILATLVFLRVLVDQSLFITADVGGAGNLNDGGRAIDNIGAVVVAMAILFAMGEALRMPSARPVAALGFLSVALILSGQATVILSAGAALLALVILERPFRDRSVIGLGATGLVGLFYATSASWVALLPPTARHLVQHRVDNLGTRQAVWESFAAKYVTRSLADRLIGLPAGSDPALIVYISGQWRPWEYSLHSMYIGLMSSVGLIGLAAYLAFLAAGLAIAALLNRTSARIGAMTPALAIAFLLLAAVEGYSYDVRQALLLMLLPPLLLVAQARWTWPRDRPVFGRSAPAAP